TRSYGDWSSDVCSSDLSAPVSCGSLSCEWTMPGRQAGSQRFRVLRAALTSLGGIRDPGYQLILLLSPAYTDRMKAITFQTSSSRSEERRVGKECRSRCT